MKIIRNPRSSGGAVVDAASLASTINTATEDTTPLDADILPMTDSSASGALRRLTFANLWTWMLGRINALSTIAGAKTFSGQVELTGQTATNETSAMTRALGDARYGGPTQFSRLAVDSAAIQLQTTPQSTGCSVTLSPGVWQVIAQTHISNAIATSGAGFRFAASIVGGVTTEDFGVSIRSRGNSIPVFENQSWLTGNRTEADSSRASQYCQGLIVVTSGNPVITTQFAQSVATATNTVARAGSFILARRIG